MPHPRTRRFAEFAGLAIGIAGSVFIVLTVVREWDEIVEAYRSAELSWIAVAALSGLAGMAVVGWWWIRFLAPDRPPPARRGSRWYFVGQLGKYVPGGVWPIVGRSELATRGGIPRAAAYRATVRSMAVTYGAAAATAAVAGVAFGPARLLAAALLVLLLALLAAITVPRSREMIERVLPARLRQAVGVPRPGPISADVLRHVPVWILVAASTACVVLALSHRMSLQGYGEILASTALAWLAGFVIVGLPGGLGVRESVFVAMMNDELGVATATSVAVMSRLVFIAVDLAGAGLSMAAGRDTRPPGSEAADTDHGLSGSSSTPRA